MAGGGRIHTKPVYNGSIHFNDAMQYCSTASYAMPMARYEPKYGYYCPYCRSRVTDNECSQCGAPRANYALPSP